MDKNEFNEKKIKEKFEWHIERALVRIGLLVEGDALQLCPVDTGNLKLSIAHEVKKEKREVTIGANTEYALNVEKGIGQSPQPYLTPAGEYNKKNIETIVAKEMRDFE